MNKKKFTIISIILIVLIVLLIFIGYKSFNLHNFNVEKKTLSLGSELNISSSKKETNYKEGNLNFYLDPTQYILDPTGTIYIKNTTISIDPNLDAIENNQEETDESYIEDYSIQFSEITNILHTTCRYSDRLNYIDYIDIMNKNKIKNEVELVKYYLNNQNTKLNILSPINKIKLDYLSSIFINALNVEGNINILNGLDGFKCNNTVYLFNNSNLYKIIFSDNYPEDEILEVLSTINFN